MFFPGWVLGLQGCARQSPEVRQSAEDSCSPGWQVLGGLSGDRGSEAGAISSPRANSRRACWGGAGAGLPRMSPRITWVAKVLLVETMAWERRGAAGAFTLSFPQWSTRPLLPSAAQEEALERGRAWPQTCGSLARSPHRLPLPKTSKPTNPQPESSPRDTCTCLT